MHQLVRASSPWTAESGVTSKSTLPPQVVGTASVRLCWISVMCAVTTVLTMLVQNLLQPDLRDLRNAYVPLMAVFVVLSSLGMVALQRFRALSPLRLLDFGLAFEVLIAFFISFWETAMQLPTDQPLVGVSAVTVWIGIVGVLMPNRPYKRLITALLSASTWPVAYYINLQMNGYTPLPTNRLISWIYLPYLMAWLSFALSRRIYRMELAVHKVLDLGSYQLVDLIGKGGMGEVWRAKHRMLARDAAIKLIRSELMIAQSGGQTDVTRARFEREARAISSLQCPHTVQLFDFGVSQDGSFYYVMELLDGISLGVLVEKFGPQPEARVIHILRDICKSLDEAHHRGLIHRDIKPTNVFICKMGLEYDFTKVLDFGLVKDLNRDRSAQLTVEGTSAGTPAFMAPEVALGEPVVDGRVDLYAVGCLAYYLLTGTMVFEESTPTATALAHVQKVPVRPSERSEMPVSPALEAIVLRCLAKKPADRPATAGELDCLLADCATAQKWTQAQAREWWTACLPDSSEYRTGHQHAHVAEAALTQEL